MERICVVRTIWKLPPNITRVVQMGGVGCVGRLRSEWAHHVVHPKIYLKLECCLEQIDVWPGDPLPWCFKLWDTSTVVERRNCSSVLTTDVSIHKFCWLHWEYCGLFVTILAYADTHVTSRSEPCPAQSGIQFNNMWDEISTILM